ncbi:MAG TPA: response regulator transcription factor [Candidatus Polarisedimenticolaceae bacterium]|nr:response regulator transcription factor [Candidatus Polarisedimenticolaceae bacterium]
MRDVHVAIVEDQRVLRDGLVSLIGGTEGFAGVRAFGSMEEAIEPLVADPPDILLADIGLPGMSGTDGVRRLKTRVPSLQVLMLTVYADNDHVFEAICAGACGYLLKDTPPNRLIEAIREVLSGGAPMSPEIARKVVETFQRIAPPPPASPHRLSPREIDVLRLLADGHVYKTAAAALDLSLDTVRFHVRNIYEKLHVHSKSEAVLAALRQGILR